MGEIWVIGYGFIHKFVRLKKTKILPDARYMEIQQCALAVATTTTDCWCDSVDFPSELLSQIQDIDMWGKKINLTV